MALLTTHVEQNDLGGGQIQNIIHPKAIAYRDGGSLFAIDNAWQDSGNPSRPHIINAAPFLISAGDDGMRRIHPTREIDRYFEIGAPYIKPAGSWQKVNLGSPTRSGNRLQWTTANANLYVDMAGHFIKLAILLKNGWQPPGGEFAFPVGLTGLTRSGGNILADGEVVMTARRPHVEDFDNPDDIRPIALDFVRQGGQRYAHFQLPDLAGMSRPLVDPTLTLQPDETDGVDTYIESSLPDTTNAGDDYLLIGERIDISSIRRTLLRFDLSTLPDSAIISATTLSLYATFDHASNTRTHRVYRQKREWVEAEATWNDYATSTAWQTAGGFGANDCEQTDIGSLSIAHNAAVNEFKNWSLTATAKTDLDYGLEQGGNATGLMVKTDTETDDGWRFSASADTTASQRPKLAITYTLPDPTGFMISTIRTRNSVLRRM